jgi:hypothetical protein
MRRNTIRMDKAPRVVDNNPKPTPLKDREVEEPLKIRTVRI